MRNITHEINTKTLLMNKIKLLWNKFCNIFGIMWNFKKKEIKTISKHRSSEISSGLVKVSHLIKSNSSKRQVVKIGDKYFKVRELG